MPPAGPATRLTAAHAWTAADRRLLPRVLLLALGVRVCSALFAWLAHATLTLNRPEQFTVFGRTHLFWDTFARWDSGWYLGLARDGYQFVEGGRSNLAFFPLYPSLMGGLGRLLGGTDADFYFAGIVISWLASIGAAGVIYALARLDLCPARAWRATLFALAFPFAFFFGVVYTEALFLLLLVTSVYALRTRRWGLAAAAGMLLTACRVNGIMALPALLWIAWTAAGESREARGRALAAAAASGLGLATYAAFNWSVAGDPLEWYWSIKRWDYHPGSFPLGALGRLWLDVLTHPYAYVSTDMGPYGLLNGLAATALLVALPGIWRRLGTGYALLVAANLVLPLSSGQLEGLGRYSAVLFPFAIWLGAVLSARTAAPVLLLCGVLYGFCCALFTTVHPLL